MSKFKSYAINRRAKFDYQIEHTYYAGVVLLGHEVVSVRNGKATLNGSFATIKNSEVWANNIRIALHQTSNPKSYDELRSRKLLLNKKEIRQLELSKQSGRHIIIMEIGSIGRYIKVKLGVGRSKRTHDKREVIKSRQANIETLRAIKRKTR